MAKWKPSKEETTIMSKSGIEVVPIVPDFIKNANEEIDSLERLAYLVDRYIEAEAAIDEAEEQLKKAKAKKAEIGGGNAGGINYPGEIPNIVLGNGLTELKLKDGRKIEIKEGISVTITDEPLFNKFLTDRKEDDIIKLSFAFERMPLTQQTKLFQFLSKEEYAFESKKGVHPKTLEKYFRGLLGLDGADGESLNKKLVEPFAKIFQFHTTKIK